MGNPKQFRGAVVTNVTYWYEYKDGVKNTKSSGIKIEVVLPGLLFEKAAVKIAGDYDQLPVIEPMTKITFNDLEFNFYQNFKTKDIGITAQASSYEVK